MLDPFRVSLTSETLAQHLRSALSGQMSGSQGSVNVWVCPDVLALDAAKLGHQEVCRNPKSNQKKVTSC